MRILFRRTEGLAYGGPDRLYVVGLDGRIAYKSRPGLFGFKPDEVRGSLKQLLPEEQTVRLGQF